VTDVSEPALDVIQQDYDEGPNPLAGITVPVRLDGPSTVHELPARTANSRFVNTDPAAVIEVLPADLRRKYATLLCTQPVWIGHDKRLTDAGEVGQIPAGVPVTLPTSAPIYCKAVTVTGVLSWWAGYWSE
jgi:hypothetical protein